MANYVRRLVSGDKARFKDHQLNMELDLVYITDHIIVMGFPATGVEGFYRNRREDAKKFLDSRHEKNYWIFNFCPVRENSYDAAFFEGRVSRYPFPDHHAPPLAIIPLFVREAREWLSGSPERVAVLHCKAGKGRSGTLACSYLLSLDQTPTPPRLQRSMTKKEWKAWAAQRADEVLQVVETKEMSQRQIEQGENLLASEEKDEASDSERMTEPETRGSSSELVPKGENESPLVNNKTSSGIMIPDTLATGIKNKALNDILALHTSRRMKVPSSPDKKLKRGVSIPSQRRFLQYWSQLLAHAAPPNFWEAPLPRARICEITIRMRKMSGVKMNVLKFANNLIEKTQSGKDRERDRGNGPVWVSLGRYDDKFVDTLEKWEKYTRSEDGHMEKRKPDSEHHENESLRDLFKDGKWDKDKMIRRYACLGNVEGAVKSPHDDNIITYVLKPLTNKKWESVQEQITSEAAPQSIAGDPHFYDPKGTPSTTSDNPTATFSPTSNSPSPPSSSSMSSASSSIEDLKQPSNESEAETGTALHSGREVRVKLYMGQVFMGWIWFIPAFHLPSYNSGTTNQTTKTTLVFNRKEVDFPIGAGSALLDVSVSLEWIRTR